MPGALASEMLGGEEPTRVRKNRKKGTYTQTIQRILLLPPLFPKDPDDDAPTEVSDRAPESGPAPIPAALPSRAARRDSLAIEPLADEADEEEWDGAMPLEVAPDPFARREAPALGATLSLVIQLACVLPFRLLLAALKLACTVALFLGFAAKALGAWVLFQSWREWLRAWERTHAAGPEP